MPSARRPHPNFAAAVAASLIAAALLLGAASVARAQQTGKNFDFSGAVTPATGPYAGQRFYSGSHVLIVGVSRYQYLAKQYWLHFADKDAIDLRGLLIRSYGFPPSSITLLLNEQATKANIEAALDGFADSDVVHVDDRVLIYFSGHGATVPTAAGGQMGFLIPYDARVDLARPQNKGGYLSSCIPMDSLWSKLSLSAARHALVIADACYGGLMVSSKKLPDERPSAPVIAPLLARPAREVLTVGGADETALEDPSLGHGAFTYKLLEELRAQAATPNWVFTAHELASALQTSVGSLTNAHQILVFGNYGSTKDDTVFVTTAPREVTTVAAVQPASATADILPAATVTPVVVGTL